MKQVSHAAKIVSALEKNEVNEENENYLESLLTAQLTHSDGIRGFFVTYLTHDGNDHEHDGDMNAVNTAKSVVPSLLISAMEKANSDELIPLACEFETICLYTKWHFVLTKELSHCFYADKSLTLNYTLCFIRHECYHAYSNDHHAQRCRAFFAIKANSRTWKESVGCS